MIVGALLVMAGLTALLYGLWLVFEPLAWLAGGLAAVGVGANMDVSRRGGR